MEKKTTNSVVAHKLWKSQKDDVEEERNCHVDEPRMKRVESAVLGLKL